MVCKEEVLSWFKDLDSYRRIDVLYELLNMCVPFELRFMGTCVEEIGKHSYQELRGPTITANDLDKLSKDTSLTMGAGALMDESVRHRVLLYVALLSSRNYAVANWLYRTLLRTDYVDEFVREKVLLNGSGRDDLHNELLLLYTMTLYHPAFTFEQKQEFARFLDPLIECRDALERTNSGRHVNHFPTNNNCATTSSSSSGSCNSYPPGLGFPAKKQLTEIPTIPVKTAPTLSYNDTVHQQHPASLPPMGGQPFEFVWWNRTAIPFAAVADVAQFPPAPQISPLVSQSESPSHSRSGSPHRTPAPAMQIRPPAVLANQPPLDGATTIQTAQPPPPAAAAPVAQPPGQPPLIDPLSQSSLAPLYNHEIKLEDELSSLQEEKQLLWAPANIMAAGDVKHHHVAAHHRHHPPTQNGYRYATFKMPPPPFIIEQMHAMSLDGENSLHQSTTSSGSSSPCQTPPGTPCGTTTTPSAAPPHGPGRGASGEKRVNGIGGVFPVVSAAPSAAPVGNMCDTTSPPPFTVPYSFPQTFTSLPPPPPIHTAVAGRSMFPAFATAPAAPSGPGAATANYRSPFTAPYTYQTDTSSFTTFSYFPIMYSSPFAPPPPPRAAQQPPPTCYNCGAPGHLGESCLAQNIEDITQKKAYQLEYSPPAATVAPTAAINDDK